MKRMLTLFFALGAFVAVQAQTSKEEARRVILGQGKNGSGGSTSTQGRDVILGGGNNYLPEFLSQFRFKGSAG